MQLTSIIIISMIEGILISLLLRYFFFRKGKKTNLKTVSYGLTFAFVLFFLNLFILDRKDSPKNHFQIKILSQQSAYPIFDTMNLNEHPCFVIANNPITLSKENRFEENFIRVTKPPEDFPNDQRFSWWVAKEINSKKYIFSLITQSSLQHYKESLQKRISKTVDSFITCKFPFRVALNENFNGLVSANKILSSVTTDQELGGNILDHITLIPELEVNLANTYDSNFFFRNSIGEDKRELLSDSSTDWNYYMKSLRSGDSLGIDVRLKLTLESGIGTTVLYLGLINNYISVRDPTIADEVKDFSKKNWAFILGPFGGIIGIWKWLIPLVKRRFNKKKQQSAGFDNRWKPKKDS